MDEGLGKTLSVVAVHEQRAKGFVHGYVLWWDSPIEVVEERGCRSEITRGITLVVGKVMQ